MTNIGTALHQLVRERNRTQQELDKLDRAIVVIQQFVKGSRNGAGGAGTGQRRQLSAAARARIAAAQRARWAKVKGKSARQSTTAPKRTLSAAGRRKIAAAQRARWAKWKQAKKTS